MPNLTLGAPENLLIFGESGGIGRLNDDGVISQWASIAEREAIYRAPPDLIHKRNDSFQFLLVELIGELHAIAVVDTVGAWH